VDVLGLGIEGRERADGRHEDAHGVGVVVETDGGHRIPFRVGGKPEAAPFSALRESLQELLYLEPRHLFDGTGVAVDPNGSFLVVTCDFGKRMDLFGLFFRGHVFVKYHSG
jgi:hypothetical protein